MPVTARLLQRLHETLGDEATSDLFAWWEEAATVNRVAVREVADLYFERFSAHLDQRLAEVRAELRTEFQRGFSDLRTEFQKGLSDLRTEMHKGISDLRTQMEKGLSDLRSEFQNEFSGLRNEFSDLRTESRTGLAAQRADLIKWMFIFWAGTVIPLAGLAVALTRF